MRRWGLIGLVAALSAGAGASAAPHGLAVAIADPSQFLVQTRCPDGALELAEPGCPGAAPQAGRDPMLMRRHDWPGPAGYQIGDSFAADDRAYYVSVFSYPPFGPFVAANGDGGEVYVIDGAAVRIAATEDGGQMGVVQGFFAAHCGGSGWVLFRNDAPTGRWASLVARLRGAPIAGACRDDAQAYTRYRLETVTIPFIIRGRRVPVALPTVISEHYDAASIARAGAMERSFMAKGVGRAVWEAWTRGGPVSGDLAARCPGTAWSIPPAPGWVLADCRYATNLTADTGALTGDRYGWPRPGLTLP